MLGLISAIPDIFSTSLSEHQFAPFWSIGHFISGLKQTICVGW